MDTLHNDGTHSAMELAQDGFKIFYMTVAKQLSRPRVAVGDSLVECGVSWLILAPDS